MENINRKLLSSIRYQYAQSVFTGKVHYKAYDRLLKHYSHESNIAKGIFIITIALLSLKLFGLENNIILLANGVALAALLLTIFSLAFEFVRNQNLAKLIYQHKGAAEEYYILRDRYINLISDVMSDKCNEKYIKERRDEFLNAYSLLGKASPVPKHDDYVAAQNALGTANKEVEEYTWSDEEIDRLLPSELRLKKE